jgi:hypothetical protein
MKGRIRGIVSSPITCRTVHLKKSIMKLGFISRIQHIARGYPMVEPMNGGYRFLRDVCGLFFVGMFSLRFLCVKSFNTSPCNKDAKGEPS